MLTLQWYSIRLVGLLLVFLGVTILPARSEVVSGGPKVGQWQT